MKYSIIIPVYNRPDEVEELLASLTQQTVRNFDVVVVEDGSNVPCKEVCERYAERLTLHYYSKPNSGPGQSRNYGAERSSGDYLIILDSDVVLPCDYLQHIDTTVEASHPDAFGGPDRSHPSFSDTQKAISYSMTSFFTTGGIRGGKKKMDKFYPRSFNMGVRREVYQQLGGFSKMRFGEDIDFSLRIFEAGYKPILIPEAWVWHKRRTDFRKFFRQVFNSGIARINLEKRHRGSMKIVHLLPAAFTICVLLLLLCAIVFMSWLPILPLVAYSLLLFIDSSIANHSAKVGVLSIAAAFVQLVGYGLGFLKAWYLRCLLGRDEFTAFDKTFYK